MARHYLEQAKQERMDKIIYAIKRAPKVRLKALLSECFDKLGMMPSLTMKYLKDLESIGKIEIDEGQDLVKVLKK